MSGRLEVECGPADIFGRRSVVARCGRDEHRDRFNADDAFRRRQFAEAALTKFRWAITADAITRIDELIICESSIEMQRAANGCSRASGGWPMCRPARWNGFGQDAWRLGR